MTMPIFRHIPERHVHRQRLGRHIEHDPQSRAFALEPDALAQPVTKVWARHGAIFDQGDLGSCTGNAMAGVINTDPFFLPGRVLTEDNAVAIYEAATRLDRVPGSYPPNDTGSSGLAAAKAAKRMGLIPSYKHAFSLHGTLMALGQGPVIAGINWYDSFDQPSGMGALVEISADATVRGGHEIEILEVHVDARLVRIANSWSDQWGDHGYFTMGWSTLERLLSEGGDVTVPLPHA